MAAARTLINAASNDDRRFPWREEDAADVFVYHGPNGPPGGTASRVELAAFLGSRQGAPERRVLVGTIGSLVVEAQSASPAPSLAPEPGAIGTEQPPGEEIATQTVSQ